MVTVLTFAPLRRWLANGPAVMVSVSPETVAFAGTLSFDLVNVIVHAESAVAATSKVVAAVSFPVVGTAVKCHVPATSASASVGAGAGAGAGAIAAVVSLGASFFAQAATTSAVQQRTRR